MANDSVLQSHSPNSEVVEPAGPAALAALEARARESDPRLHRLAVFLHPSFNF